MSNHTPGPWYAANGNEIHDHRAEFDSDGARTGNTPNRIAAVEYPYGGSFGQSANARLIAAAPELLDAIRACLFYVPLGSQTRTIADDLINRIEGHNP